MDVKNAFLYVVIDKEIYMEEMRVWRSAEPGICLQVEESFVWAETSTKSMAWKIVEFLVFNGYIVAPADSSLFVKQNYGWIIVVIIYVDDFIITEKTWMKSH